MTALFDIEHTYRLRFLIHIHLGGFIFHFYHNAWWWWFMLVFTETLVIEMWTGFLCIFMSWWCLMLMWRFNIKNWCVKIGSFLFECLDFSDFWIMFEGIGLFGEALVWYPGNFYLESFNYGWHHGCTSWPTQQSRSAFQSFSIFLSFACSFRCTRAPDVILIVFVKM